MKILAFPGMGKTPLAFKSAKYLDLDFGHFRQSLNVQKADEHKLLKPFARLMDLYEHDGFIVLSNDPKLMSVTDIDRVYLPANVVFAARKLNTDPGTAAQWVADWAEEAKRHQVPVVYLKVGLDHYLTSGRKTNERRKTDEASKDNTPRS